MGAEVKAVLAGFHSTEDVSLFLQKVGYESIETLNERVQALETGAGTFTTRSATLSFKDPTSKIVDYLNYFSCDSYYTGSAPIDEGMEVTQISGSLYWQAPRAIAGVVEHTGGWLLLTDDDDAWEIVAKTRGVTEDEAFAFRATALSRSATRALAQAGRVARLPDGFTDGIHVEIAALVEKRLRALTPGTAVDPGHTPGPGR